MPPLTGTFLGNYRHPVHTVCSIVVVGGGSSGWMAAAYLNRLFPDVRITLVESPRVSTIGVGEATVPLLNQFMSRLGFADPQSWMPACDATFKTGILFENWHARGERYWHPFDLLDYVDSIHHTGHCWYTMRHAGRPQFQDRSSFADAFFPSAELNVRQNRAPWFREYAFHLDSAKFGEFLRAASPTVNHILDDVVDVSIEADGSIASVRTADHGDVSADLYIDCSGFHRRLISRVAEQGFESYARSLLCDRAVVIRVPYDESDDRERVVRPYVLSSAQEAGWIWSIPLYDRMSSGYVYSSQFTSDERAEAVLRHSWRAKDLTGLQVLKIRFDAGKLPRTWVRNCVAVGLSGGFIEPLESTGLAITQMGIEMVASMLDARFYDEPSIARYNGHMDKFYTDIMHFIIAHYLLSSREDSDFWRAVRHDAFVPDTLQQRLEVFRRLLPTSATKGTAEVFMFRDISWFAVLLGMNFRFAPEPVDQRLVSASQAIAARKRASVQEGLVKLPNHYRYLKEVIYGKP